jgi:nitrogen-specific signal transduction histidine kinase/DNA-binding NarL/FixJ family response regulator
MTAMPKPKILIVDDEAGIRKVLGISLADRGYAVLTAENATEALQTFDREQPEIVLTDIKMPGMDGIELLRRLKRDNPDTEVVVITGHGDMDLAIKSLKYEATDFITKPIEDADLDRALQKSRERIQLRGHLRQYTENLEDLLRRKSEHLAAQAQSGAMPSNLLEDLPGYVTVHDADYHITAANSRFKDDFAFDPRSGAICYELIQGSPTPCEACPVAQTFADAKSHQSELAYTTKTGKDCHLFAWTTPLREKTGKVGAVMLMATDISPIMDIRDHLSSLGLMIGSVSHSIKGMLTGLDGGLYMLDRGFVKDDADQVSEGLDIVKMMVGRIKNMVLDILYYAKERDLEKAPCPVKAFAEETASIVQSRVADAQLDLACDFSAVPETSVFTIDSDQLRSALVNILENAVDACLEKGDAVPPQIQFRVYPEDADLVFEIQDNGIGMPSEVQDRIFTLFFSSKATQGTGIGLFITRKIVHQHGGRITVESQPGEGTLFRVTIPGR